jgi:hypothetical protein
LIKTCSYKAIELQSDEDYEKIREKLYDKEIGCIDYCPFIRNEVFLYFLSIELRCAHCELKEMFGRYSP